MLISVGGKIGIIIGKDPNVRNATFEVTVISQWGADGEYIHLLNEVPACYGEAEEFWTDRRTSL